MIRKTGKSIFIVIFSLFFMLNTVTFVFADESITEYELNDLSLWAEEVQEYGSVPIDEACTFKIEEGVLAIGPWFAGEYAARYRYEQDFNILDGTVEGYYKTNNTESGQVQVVVNLKSSGGSSIHKYRYHLPNSDDWIHFELPIRRPPPGSTKIELSFGNAFKNEGIVYFKDLKVSNKKWKNSFPEESPELTRNGAPARFAAGEKWRLEEADGTWWFVKPNGEPFYSLGLELPFYGSYTADLFPMLKGLSFNTMDGWTNIKDVGPVNDAQDEPLPAIITLQSSSLGGISDYGRLVSALGESPNLHTMSDPFDPGWRAAYKARVEGIKAATEGKEWFIGYFADNEVNHTDLHRKVYSNHCSIALKNWLSDRYNGDIENLNTAWNSEYTSFNDLIEKKPDPVVRKGRMYEDYMAFRRVLVAKYVNETISVFEEVYEGQPLPLIFSNRFMIDMTEVFDLLDIYAEAYDGISINIYPGSLQVGLPGWAKDTIVKAHDISKKPIIIGEWSVAALDSGLYEDWTRMDWSFEEAFDTQEERAKQAEYVTAEFYNLPFVVGSHWYKWYDFSVSKPGSVDTSRNANRGVFDHTGLNPWTKLTGKLKDVHDRIYVEVERAAAIEAAAVEAAIDAIEALKEANEITLADEGDVAIARGLVDVAIAKGAEDSDITNLAKLAAAEAKIADLKRPVIPTPPVTPPAPPETSEKPKVEVEKDEKGNVSLRISKIKVDDGKLPVIDIGLLLEDEEIMWNNADLPVTVTIDYTLTDEDIEDYEYLTVNYVDEDGNLVSVPNAKYNVKDGSISFITTKPGKFEVILEKKVFTDSGKLSWAQKPIEVLLSKGIIDKGEESYHPEAEITRGEFISMIVRALGLTANIKENFDDVKADNPYYCGIGIAKALGIAKGVGYNNYNPNKAISRQDMMVLTNRALEISKKLKTKSDISQLDKMTDNDKVSEYAKQSIANLVGIGIIQGDGKRIMPKEYTNKAAAAVVIYKVLGL